VVSSSGHIAHFNANSKTTESLLLRLPQPSLPLNPKLKPPPLPSELSPELPLEETPTEDEEVPEVEGLRVNRGTLAPQAETSRKDSSTPLDLTANESVSIIVVNIGIELIAAAASKKAHKGPDAHTKGPRENRPIRNPTSGGHSVRSILLMRI